MTTSNESWCEIGLPGTSVNGMRKKLDELRFGGERIVPPVLTRHVGRYNLLNSQEESACLTVTFNVGFGLQRLSVTVEVDGRHDYEGEDPFEAINFIEAAYKSYWIHTGKEEAFKKIAVFREHRLTLRVAWLEKEAVRLQKKAAAAYEDARQALKEFNDFVDELTDEDDN